MCIRDSQDPIVIIDGLTKNWRYPGFRVSWTVGPKNIIEGISSAGSFLDGGCARPMQLASLDIVNSKIANQEAQSIQKEFIKKRDFIYNELTSLGIKISPKPDGAFYCWGDVSALPNSINDGISFFRKALEHKVITVPGQFFDINPGQRRSNRPSRFKNFVRFSFGPSIEELEMGIDSLKKMI